MTAWGSGSARKALDLVRLASANVSAAKKLCSCNPPQEKDLAVMFRADLVPGSDSSGTIPRVMTLNVITAFSCLLLSLGVIAYFTVLVKRMGLRCSATEAYGGNVSSNWQCVLSSRKADVPDDMVAEERMHRGPSRKKNSRKSLLHCDFSSEKSQLKLFGENAACALCGYL
ncbi:hypothetical protein AXG93_3437s1160 [Marchantia polymorpha subsp. ruderalis]|uniref:Uncharacterized protein n=1 Tax=Marchantia polymorpha subsp. ruderalis TaxID=1480154 RepID=A0A176VZ85_MARPO|nr:hypothetical protein AXG93_3437s1160 [Marchantia polymorpha subsp. ruderalis]